MKWLLHTTLPAQLNTLSASCIIYPRYEAHVRLKVLTQQRHLTRPDFSAHVMLQATLRNTFFHLKLQKTPRGLFQTKSGAVAISWGLRTQLGEYHRFVRFQLPGSRATTLPGRFFSSLLVQCPRSTVSFEVPSTITETQSNLADRMFVNVSFLGLNDRSCMITRVISIRAYNKI